MRPDLSIRNVATAPSRASASSTAGVPCGWGPSSNVSAIVVESSISAAIVLLPQPKRQPPAIQIDTLIDSSNRTTLVEKNKLISLAVYPSGPLFVEITSRIKIVIKFQHFCNGRLVSLKL